MQKDSGQQASSFFFRAVPQLSQIQNSLSVVQFSQYLKHRDTTLEFQLISLLTNTNRHKMLLHNPSAQENVLNRFREEQKLSKIFQHNRVKLKKKIQDRYKDIDYINANIVSSEPYKIIVTQGPKSDTVRDFHQMLKQQKTQYVIMLCEFKQGSKPKCQNYISGNYDYQITEEEQISNTITFRTVKDLETNHTYKHIHYTGWPDHGTPLSYQDVRTVIGLVDIKKGVTIHCLAGIGRSGAMAALLTCIKEMQKTGDINVFRNTRKIRQNRYGAIENSRQYKFLYDYIEWSLNNKTLSEDDTQKTRK